MVSEWVPSTPYNLQSDILSVYYKALAYSTTINESEIGQKYIEASSLSLNNDGLRIYSVKDSLKNL